MWVVVDALFESRWKEEEDLDRNSLMYIKVTAGEQEVVQLEIVILIRMRLLLPAGYNRLNSYNENRSKDSHGKACKKIRSQKRPVIAKLVNGEGDGYCYQVTPQTKMMRSG